MRKALIVTVAIFACASRVNADPPTPEQVREAAVKSLALLQKAAAKYTEHRQCFSCHHQALPTLAMLTARAHGFEVDEKAILHQLTFTAEFLTKNRDNYRKGKGQGGQADTAGYALFLLNAGRWHADDTTDAVIEYLLQRDKERENWLPVSQRPPTEASAFTTTFLAVSALKHYGWDAKQDEIDARIEKTRKWLVATKPKDTEDRVFRLRAMKLAGADDKVVQAAADELTKTQRPDGGWAQLDQLDSDAYATGSVLAALHQAGGLDVKSDVYQRGVQFLVETQKEDGSWYIKSRSKPFQLYFESGFPHTKDQWISCAGSSWATVALVLTFDTAPARLKLPPWAPHFRYHNVPGYAPILAQALRQHQLKDGRVRIVAAGPTKLFVYGPPAFHDQIDREIPALTYMFAWMGFPDEK